MRPASGKCQSNPSVVLASRNVPWRTTSNSSKPCVYAYSSERPIPQLIETASTESRYPWSAPSIPFQFIFEVSNVLCVRIAFVDPLDALGLKVGLRPAPFQH